MIVPCFCSVLKCVGVGCVVEGWQEGDNPQGWQRQWVAPLLSRTCWPPLTLLLLLWMFVAGHAAGEVRPGEVLALMGPSGSGEEG